MIGALGFLLYLPSLSGGFVWDDTSLFAGGWLARPDALATIWFRPGEIRTEEHYWPVLYTLFYLQHLLWGSEPTGYRLVNMVLHAGNGLLLLGLLRQLQVRWAFAAAALFAVHPAHVESVAWIIELKDVLSGCFMLAAMLAFFLSMREVRSRAVFWGWLLLSFVLFAAALGSKSVSVVTPVALAVICWWRGDGLRRREVLALTPFFLLSAAYTALDLGFVAKASNPALEFSLLERVSIAGRAFWFYIGKSFWPLGLGPVYPLWSVEAATMASLGPALLAVALLVTLAMASRRLGRGPVALAVLFTVTLLPTLGLVPFTFQQYSFVADRYLYLPVACPAVAAAYAAAGLSDRLAATSFRFMPGLVLIAAGVLLIVQTLQYIPVYRDNESWARAVLARNPQAVIGHQVLGVTLLARGDIAGAMPHLQAVIERQPGNASAHYNLAVAHALAGRTEQALECVGRALAADPEHRNALSLRDRLTTPTP
ncbi:MAG: tetratricopeptide repeat protein [Candidatus Sumerlaeaceae bacterium]|nr:tetratricopeptide repeat protein [Candidatus Sumerlaeaceae bacterium]